MRATQRQLDALIRPLRELRRRAVDLEQLFAEELERVHPEHLDSARNLLHYLALRQNDLRPLQDELAAVGLSSLGRMEPHALATLDAVLWAVEALAGGTSTPRGDLEAPCDFVSGPARLTWNARTLLGPEPYRRPVRIMVTMPPEAATDPRLVHELVAAGMDLMRINCAHDDLDAWRAMIRNLREAERAVGRSCKIYADLPGPKLRTGRLPTGARVCKLKLERDVRGNPVRRGCVWLTPADQPEAAPEDVAHVLPLVGDVLREAERGDALLVDDARGRERRLRVEERRGGSCLATYRRTLYAETGKVVTLVRGGEPVAEGAIAELPEVGGSVRLFPGDRLILTREEELHDLADDPRDGAGRDDDEPPRVHCSLPEVFGQVRPHEPVWFDDGAIGGTVESVTPDEIEVRITHTDPQGGRLRAEKGINFPESALDVPALTPTDLEDLGAIVHEVDIVGMSFVRRPGDVELLEEQLRALDAPDVGVLLKIENRAAFEDLPRILLTALRYPSVGVMVARGDLAVEVGFERLSEVQEEILWLCEAAHVPVVWATQVLETLAKTGRASRAEVTDAAMGVRAECVMLNKGRHIVRAVEFLTSVLDRMSAHQSKKRTRLRPLSVSRVRQLA